MYTHYLKAIISFLFLFFSSSYIMAEKNPFFFTQIGNESGLTENTITDLFQDSDGYIWIGTIMDYSSMTDTDVKSIVTDPIAQHFRRQHDLVHRRRQQAKYLDHNRTSCAQNRQAKPTNT